MGNIFKNSLRGELSNFGLNAEDWVIEKDHAQEDQYLLVHVRDPDFQMRGSVEFRSEETISWSEISIAWV